MTVRRLVFVATADDAPPPSAETGIVVLDTAWTPAGDEREDLIPIRPAIAATLEQHDLVDESLTKLDAWAETMGLPQRLQVAGVSWWFRRRAHDLAWLQRRLLWRRTLEQLLDGRAIAEVELRVREAALIDVLVLLAGQGRFAFRVAVKDGDGGPASARPRRPDHSTVWRLKRFVGAPRRRLRRRALARRSVALDRRIRSLSSSRRPRVLVLSSSRTEQIVRRLGRDRRLDPFLAPVIGRLEREGLDPVIFAFGLSRLEDAAWRTIDGDGRILPGTLLEERYGRHDDPIEARQQIDACVDLDGLPDSPLEVDGIDLAAALRASVRHFVRQGLVGNLRELATAQRFLAELRPVAIVLVNEYSRTPWLVAARDAGIPTFAVQHGLIYPWHGGYRHEREPGLILPTRTFVFGPYEERVLLEFGGYRPSEVEVTGAPRHDLVSKRPAGSRAAAVDRRAVRRELGIARDARCLVVSTTWEDVNRRFYLTQALARLFDGPLPGIHVVFKLHPAEPTDGPYRAIVEGVARAAGHEPPPVTVVRDIDLFRLLAAADAHLGLYSTVLTDAVVAGTPNLVAVTQARRDLLGYVDAGVATPVASSADLRAVLQDPAPPDLETRQRFIEDHFLPGDASARIVAAIRRSLDAGGAAA